MRRLYPAMILAIVTAACAQKHPAATPANHATAAPVTEATPSPTATCCCDRAGEQSKFEPADACVANHGTCASEEDNCHGIEEPIP